MALVDVIEAAKKHFIGGRIEEGDVYVFQCPDGLVIISKQDGGVRFEGIAGGEVIHLTEKLEIATEIKEDTQNG